VRVAIHSNTYYRRLAEDNVRRAGMTEPPIALERIAEMLGVPVRRASLPPFFLAAIVNEDGLPTILVNSQAGERDRRRAFGHVLGHLLEVLADEEASYPRTMTEHREADMLAGALVMPDSFVVDQARKWFNDHRYLAGLFGVTEDEMFERMVDLGLVQQRGPRWDY
jgi:Zn-dependent peptidase ImmA (M78 family)